MFSFKANKKILCLCGGVGGAKLAFGLSKVLSPEQLNIVVNTGDDFNHLGFPISPDIDTVIYTLAEINNKQLGWGRENETWHFMDNIKKEGGESGFRLGDKDIETHTLRKTLLNQSKTLSEATAIIGERLGVQYKIIPMSDEPVQTIVDTEQGELAFQHYFVREQCKPRVRAVRFAGAEDAQPSPDFLEALNDDNLAAVLVCPSNPFLSVDPILALQGVKQKLMGLTVPVIAVSPIIAGRAIKGPTVKMMKEMNMLSNSAEIAEYYKEWIDILVLDKSDQKEKSLIEEKGIKVLSSKTLMKSEEDKINLALFLLEGL